MLEVGGGFKSRPTQFLKPNDVTAAIGTPIPGVSKY
jgi:hypothetical protein